MLVFIAWFVWIAIWGVIGYASFSTIISRIKMKRDTDSMVEYWAKKRQLEQEMQVNLYKALNYNSVKEDVKPYGKES